MEEELAIGRELQMSMLPLSDKLGLVIGDVAGKSVSGVP